MSLEQARSITSQSFAESSQDWAGESTISYEYMQWGSLVKSITNATGTVTYGYNNKGIVTSETSTADNTSKSYTYDKNGNQTNLTISQNGSQLINQTNTFNSVGQLTQVYDAKNSKTLVSYTYDNVGNVTSKETANGMQKTTYSYNESNLLTKVQNMSIGNQQTGQFGTYSSYAYEYYLDGSKEKETDNIGKTKSYTYDGAGRLLTEISARGGGGEQDGAGDSKTSTYKYDARGNRIEKRTTDTEMEEYTYDKNNRLIHRYLYYSYINNSFEYKYDNNGNLTEKTVDEYYDEFDDWDGDMRVVHVNKYDISYTYNFFNQLTGVNRTDICKDYAYCDDTSIAYYTYDPTGKRISKTVDGVTTNHIWDNNGNIVAENDKIYNRGLGGEILSAGDNYYAYNGHGDTTNLTQQSSGVALAMTATYEYDAFGNCLATGGEADNNPFRYNGQYYDEESGLYYLRNRYYDPSIGRFTQEDPAKDGLNWYVYCGNDPVNLVDPLGLWMDGDENLSSAAQLYTKYYGDLWELSNRHYNSAKKDNNIEEMQKAEQDMKKYHNLADDIRIKDAKGEVYGGQFDVPHIEQGMEPICYACDAMMVYGWYTGTTPTTNEAILYAKAFDLEKYKNGEGNFVPGKKTSYDSEHSGYVASQIKKYDMPLVAELISNREGVSNHVVTISGSAYAEGHEAIIKYNDSNKGSAKTTTLKAFERSYSKYTLENIIVPSLTAIKEIVDKISN